MDLGEGGVSLFQMGATRYLFQGQHALRREFGGHVDIERSIGYAREVGAVAVGVYPVKKPDAGMVDVVYANAEFLGHFLPKLRGSWWSKGPVASVGCGDVDLQECQIGHEHLFDGEGFTIGRGIDFVGDRSFVEGADPSLSLYLQCRFFLQYHGENGTFFRILPRRHGRNGCTTTGEQECCSKQQPFKHFAGPL